MKKDTWVKIQNEFNSQLVENPRSATVLKSKYDNIKRTVKKQYAKKKLLVEVLVEDPLKRLSVCRLRRKLEKCYRTN